MKMEKSPRGNEPSPSTGMQRESYEWNRVTNERVAKRAFELFLARGGQHGDDVNDWLQAERELSTGRP